MQKVAGLIDGLATRLTLVTLWRLERRCGRFGEYFIWSRS